MQSKRRSSPRNKVRSLSKKPESAPRSKKPKMKSNPKAKKVKSRGLEKDYAGTPGGPRIIILCGRCSGRHVTSEGNNYFRELVFSTRKRYAEAEKRTKGLISREIVDHILNEKKGKFLKLNTSTGRWEVLPYKKCVEKTSQTFRDFKSKQLVTPRRIRLVKPVQPNRPAQHKNTPPSQVSDDEKSVKPSTTHSVSTRSTTLPFPVLANRQSHEISAGNVPMRSALIVEQDALHFLPRQEGADLDSTKEDGIPRIPTPPDFVATSSFVSVWDEEKSKWCIHHDDTPSTWRDHSSLSDTEQHDDDEFSLITLEDPDLNLIPVQGVE